MENNIKAFENNSSTNIENIKSARDNLQEIEDDSSTNIDNIKSARDNLQEIEDDSFANIYNMKNKDEYSYKTIGLTEDVIKDISKQKNEPNWMLDLRLKALEMFNKLNMPTWGPDLSLI